MSISETKSQTDTSFSGGEKQASAALPDESRSPRSTGVTTTNGPQWG